MKKVLTSLLVISLVLLGAVGCEKAEDEPTEPEATAEAEAEEEAQEEPAEEEPAEEEAEEGGQWVEAEAYELKFRVPDDWKVVKDDEGVSATDPDGTTTVFLAGSESEQLARSMFNDLRSDLKFDEVEIEKTGPTTINGIPAFEGQGTAVLEKEEMDQEIQFLGYTIQQEGGGAATLFIFSEAEMYEAKKEQIHGIAQTLVETS